MNVNWLALVIAALVPTVMGFIWYHKAVFGKTWMASIGMTEEQAQKANMPLVFGIALVMSFIVAFFFTNFNNGPGQEGEYDTFKHGALHGVLIALFIAMPVLATNGMFEQRSWKNILINIGYWVVTFAIMGGIVDAMNHWG